MSPPTLLDTAALCQRWTISLSTLHRLIRSNAIPTPSRLGRRLLRWRLADIEQYERRLQAAAAKTEPEQQEV